MVLRMSSPYCFRNTHLYQVDGRKLVYVSYVGNYGEPLFKYGMTKDVYQRFIAHRRTFEVFEPLLIYPTHHCDYVEEMLEKELKFHSLHRNRVFRAKKQTELFTTNQEYTLDHVDQWVQDILQLVHAKHRTEYDAAKDRWTL